MKYITLFTKDGFKITEIEVQDNFKSLSNGKQIKKTVGWCGTSVRNDLNAVFF